MKLDQTMSVTPPPFSDNNSKIIHPPAMTFEFLKVIYIDDPDQKQYYVKIDKFPSPIYLFIGEEYINAGLINKEIAEKQLRIALGDDPASVLRKLFPRTMEEDPNGPGSVLSQMIKSVGIVMTQGCSCRRHAIEMNVNGNDWCENNVDTIVGWLKEEAKKRKLPFLDSIGKLMVARAIKKSRKLLANEPVPENDEELDQIV